MTSEGLGTPKILISEADLPIRKVNSVATSQLDVSVNNENHPKTGTEKTKRKETRFKLLDQEERSSLKVDRTESNQKSLIDILPNLNEPDYEYPLLECGCFEIYWSPYFTKIIKRLFGMDLKCRSKKGTPLYGVKEPRKKSKLGKWLNNSAASVRRKSISAKNAISREWAEIMPTLRWNPQDAHYIERLAMEQEISRLRKALEDSHYVAENQSQQLHGSQRNHPVGGASTSFQLISPQSQSHRNSFMLDGSALDISQRQANLA